MTCFFDSPRARRALEFFQKHPLFAAHTASLQQLGPAQPRTSQRLLQAPAPDRRMT